MKVEIDLDYIDGSVEDAILGRAALHITAGIREHLDDAIRDVAQKAIAKAVDEAIVDAVRRAVEDVMNRGIVPTNEWGERRGEPVTIVQRIHGMLSAVSQRDAYSKKGTLLENIIEKELTQVFERHCAEELKAAKEKIRATVDGLIQAKLADVMKSALGLK